MAVKHDCSCLFHDLSVKTLIVAFFQMFDNIHIVPLQAIWHMSRLFKTVYSQTYSLKAVRLACLVHCLAAFILV